MHRKPVILILFILLLCFGCRCVQNTIILADHQEYVLTNDDADSLNQLAEEIKAGSPLQDSILYDTSISVEIHFTNGGHVVFAGDQFYDANNHSVYRIDIEYLVERVLPELTTITDKYHVFGCLIGVGTDILTMSSTLVDMSDYMTYIDPKELAVLFASELSHAEIVKPSDFSVLYRLTITSRYRDYEINLGENVLSVDGKYYSSKESVDVVTKFVEYVKSLSDLSFIEYYGKYNGD